MPVKILNALISANKVALDSTGMDRFKRFTSISNLMDEYYKRLPDHIKIAYGNLQHNVRNKQNIGSNYQKRLDNGDYNIHGTPNKVLMEQMINEYALSCYQIQLSTIQLLEEWLTGVS